VKQLRKDNLIANTVKRGLREELFQKYFEQTDGILAIDFIHRLSFIEESWKQLHRLCEKNIEYFHFMSSLEKIKLIQHKNREYLILKLGLWSYVIIDLEKKESISQTDFLTLFDEDFFVTHFDEEKEEKGVFEKFYLVQEYKGDVEELYDFYLKQKHIFELSPCINYSCSIGEANTSFTIDFANARVYLGFQTPDQFLYENLNFTFDLVPWNMQDFIPKIGLEQCMDVMKRIKEIQIPKERIPSDLYEQYLIESKKEAYQLKKTNGRENRFH
jgi:hypothetical protein